jgi:hypothetical protein
VGPWRAFIKGVRSCSVKDALWILDERASERFDPWG